MLRARRYFALVTALALAAAGTNTLIAQGTAPRPPSTLQAVSATKSEVRLTWTGEGDTFVVERKGLGGMYATAGPAADTTYTDQKIEQFSTYVYRVRAVRSDATGTPLMSAPSNEITVGPPPSGFSTIVPASPRGSEDAFGRHPAMTLDDNGDPAIAYNVLQAEGSDAHLLFVSWNRARYTWNPPVRVAVSGEVDTNGDDRGISLAGDAGASLFAIAYQTGKGDGRGVSLAISTDRGVTWRTEVVQAVDDDQRSQSPAVAVAGGVTHVAYVHNNNGVRYRSRSGAGPWTNVVAPVPAGHEQARTNAGMALDSAGRPAVFYWYNQRDSPRSVLAFWRPGQPTAVEAMDTRPGSDDAFAALAFAGTQPRFMVNLIRDDNFEDHLWFTQSTDGTAWSAPVRMPIDVGDYWSWPVSLAVDSKGRAVATTTISGGRGAALGRPKMLRSDDLKKWTVWSPDTNRLLVSVPVVGQVMFAANDKQYVVFTSHDPSRKIPAGLNLWREP